MEDVVRFVVQRVLVALGVEDSLPPELQYREPEE
jgi:hypothetical protein